jgi:hypothetical protein
MAYEGPQVKVSLIAGESLTAKQYYFVKLSAANTVICCAGATDVPIGVLQNKPAAGEAAEVCISGITKVSGDADLAFGNLVGTSADGQADAKSVGVDTTEYVVGIVIADNGAAGGLATIALNCCNPHRAV